MFIEKRGFGMRLVDIVKSECVVAGMEASGKEDCLEKIAHIAKKSSLLDGVAEADVLAGFKNREDLGSTGYGHGIAIPHCRLPGVKDFVVGIVTIPAGLDFDSMDGEKTNVLVFIIAPESEANGHVHLLSAVSGILRIADARTEMVAASSSELLSESFLRHGRDDLKSNEDEERYLFHITVVNDDMFKDILQAVTAMDPVSVSVVDVKQSSEYLSKMPLFAGFWNDRESDSARVIIAQIVKHLTNETIRRIEDVTGKLTESTEVSVSVQKLFYSAGSISA